MLIWDVWRDLVSFAQFKIREEHPWRSVILHSSMGVFYVFYIVQMVPNGARYPVNFFFHYQLNWSINIYLSNISSIWINYLKFIELELTLIKVYQCVLFLLRFKIFTDASFRKSWSDSVFFYFGSLSKETARK